MRLLKRPEVQAKTGLAKTQIYDRMIAGTFPRSVKLSSKAVGWVEEEINQWIRDRIAERDRTGA
jgi:prophage regulatory protein